MDDPCVLAAAQVLLNQVPQVLDEQNAVRVARQVLAAAEAVPQQQRVAYSVHCSVEQARADEMAADPVTRWRAAFVRVALASSEAWEFAGLDPSQVLRQTLAEPLATLVRHCSEVVAQFGGVQEWPAEVLERAAAEMTGAGGTGVGAARLLRDDDEHRWYEVYRSGVRQLMAALLPGVAGGTAVLLLGGDVEQAQLMAQRARLWISDDDLAAAGITAVGDGSWHLTTTTS